LTISVKAYTGDIYYKWDPKPVCYFPLRVGDQWSYYSTETGSSREPIEFNAVSDSVLIQGRTYFRYNGNYFRSDSFGHVYKYYENREILWFDFTKAEGESYEVNYGGYHYKVTMTSRHATVQNWAGKFTDCLSLYFDDPTLFDDQFEYVFAENMGIVQQNLAHAIWLELYEATIHGTHYPDLKNYFPLEFGNYWLYREEGIDALIRVRILDTLTVDGNVCAYYGSNKTAFPQNVILEQNYPTPFTPSTTSGYEVATAGEVEFNLYNMLGQRIRRFKVFNTPGVHRFDLSANNLTSGVYLYEIKSGQYIERKKLIVQK